MNAWYRMKSFNHKQLPEVYASIETTVKQKICLLRVEQYFDQVLEFSENWSYMGYRYHILSLQIGLARSEYL